jgi:hypothetical protein
LRLLLQHKNVCQKILISGIHLLADNFVSSI